MPNVSSDGVSAAAAAVVVVVGRISAGNGGASGIVELNFLGELIVNRLRIVKKIFNV